MRIIAVYFFITLFISQNLCSQVPVINSFSPVSGPIGTTVTITGSNFSSTPSSNIVYFGAVRASVNSATANSLVVVVPAGASFQPITVVVNGLIALSAKPFLVTFTKGESTFISNSFEPVINYSSSIGTSCIAAGDFDLDGKADIFSVSMVTNSLLAFRNISNANITLATPTYIAAGNTPISLVTGDLDGDGKLDIVMVNVGNNTISLLKNTSFGAGVISFSTMINLSTGKSPYAATIRDFNSDGKLDIAVVNSDDNTVSIFKNNSSVGTLSFSEKVDFLTGSLPYWIDANDLDGDGKPDIATANGVATNSVSVLRNTSTSSVISFSSKTDFDGGNLALGISMADLDGDGKQDLIVANTAVSAASVLLNTSNSPGSISFSAKQELSNGYFAYSAVPGDINGDGKIDIIVGNKNHYSVSIFKNSSSVGAFSFDSKINYTVHYGPRLVIPIDLNNDGMMDIAAANYDFGNVSVLQKKKVPLPLISSFNPTQAGNGDTIIINGSNFANVNSVIFGSVKALSFRVLSDTQISAVVNNGSYGKIFVANEASTDSIAGFQYVAPPKITSINSLSALPGEILTIHGTSFNQIDSVIIGEYNARSFIVESAETIKAVVDSFSGGEVKVSGRFGAGSFTGFYNGPVIKSFSPASGYIGSEVVIKGARFGTNILNIQVYFGTMKASVMSQTDSSIIVIVPAGTTLQPISVTCNKLIAFSDRGFIQLYSAGDSTINSNSFKNVLDLFTSTDPQKIVTGDFDNDGKPDLVVVEDKVVNVYRNNSSSGNISFSKINLAFGGPVVDIFDIDNDGKLDIIALYGGGTMTIFRNQTSGGVLSFSPAQVLVLANISDYRPGIIDFDQDGRADLVIANRNDAVLNVYRNTSKNGIIKFDRPDRLENAYGVIAVNTGDIDGDGKPDIVATANGANLYFYKNVSNTGILAFEKLRVIKTNTNDGLGPLLISDINNDNKLDLVSGESSVLVLKNTSSLDSVSFEEYKVSGILDVFDLTMHDYNGDGKPDIAGVCRILNKIFIVKNNSNGDIIDFSSPVEYLANQYPMGISSIDFDIDGKPDLAITNFGSKISFLQNRIGENILIELCPPSSSTSILSNQLGTNYQWQVNTGTGFINLINTTFYNDVNTSLLQLVNITSSATQFQYRCIVDGKISNIFELKFLNSWTGALSAGWENAANWTCGSIPDSNTDVVINSGTIIINSDVTIRSLKVSPGATVTVSPGFNLTVLH